MITTILFDYGGTLDSDGVAWIDQFRRIYKEEGLCVPEERFARAFYDSDDHLAERFDLSGKGLAETVALQAGCMARELAPADPGLAERVARRFVADSRRAFARNRPVLERLKQRYRLGIVSNFYGNLERLLAGEGLLPLFGAVADSAVVGALKPDPAIFRWALERLGARAEGALMVGDNPRRDMAGAEALGMPHVLLSPGAAPCCARGRVIARFSELEEQLAEAPV